MSIRPTDSSAQIDSIKAAIQPEVTQPHQARDGADGSQLGERGRPADYAARGHTGHLTANPEKVEGSLPQKATAQIEALAQRSRLNEAGLLSSGKHENIKQLSDTHHAVAHGHEVSAQEIEAAKAQPTQAFADKAPRNIHVD